MSEALTGKYEARQDVRTTVVVMVVGVVTVQPDKMSEPAPDSASVPVITPVCNASVPPAADTAVPASVPLAEDVKLKLLPLATVMLTLNRGEAISNAPATAAGALVRSRAPLPVTVPPAANTKLAVAEAITFRVPTSDVNGRVRM